MDFIDTHLHLDSDAFDPDRVAVLAASRAAGVRRWINVGFSEPTWASTLALAERTPGLHYMIGLHPGNADDWSDALQGRLRELVIASNPVAIGEIGIDLYWRQDNLPLQARAFGAQLALARERDIPAVIHMRDADDALLQMLEEAGNLPRMHFHSFDGNAALQRWVLDHGATIGVGGLITRNGTEELRSFIQALPQDRVVLETDAPWLKPRGIRGKRNEPAYLVRTARHLAELWGTDIASIAAVTTENAERTFGLNRNGA